MTMMGERRGDPFGRERLGLTPGPLGHGSFRIPTNLNVYCR